MKKNGFAALIIILIVVILGVVGYFVYKNSQYTLSPSSNPNTQTVTTKEYITKGNASKIDFPKLSFNYLSDWMVTEKARPGDSVDNTTVTKNGYIVHINQELVTGPGVCYFKDSPTMSELNIPGTDLQTVDYTEIDSSFGHLRYFRFPSVDNGLPTNSYGFCVKDTTNHSVNRDVYIVPALGYVSLDVPSSGNNTIFQEALNVVKSIRPF